MLITIDGVLRELPLPSSMTSEPSGRASAARRAGDEYRAARRRCFYAAAAGQGIAGALVIEQRPQIGAFIAVRAPDELRVRIVDRHAAGARQQHLDELPEGRVATGGWAVRGRAGRHGICLNEQAGVPRAEWCKKSAAKTLMAVATTAVSELFRPAGQETRRLAGWRTTLRGSARSTLLMSST